MRRARLRGTARADGEQERGDRDERDDDGDGPAGEQAGNRWQQEQQAEDRRLGEPRQERLGAAARRASRSRSR